MTESVPGYHDHPHPPTIDRTKLRAQLLLFVQSGAGDAEARALLVQAEQALEQAEALAHCVGHCQHRLEALVRLSEQHFARIETALMAVENLLVTGNEMTLQVKLLTATAKPPTRAYEHDAGLDLYSDENVTIPPGQSRTVRTGIAVSIDPYKVGQIWPRSGLDAKHDVTRGAGIVDAGYRDEVKVLLRNHSARHFGIVQGDRIAQLVLTPVCPDAVVVVDELPASDRGARGFGSSGV